jgi:hypothetical protein
MFSTNYKVLQNDENGKLWLFLKKNGGWFSDNAYFILENFVSMRVFVALWGVVSYFRGSGQRKSGETKQRRVNAGGFDRAGARRRP